VYDWVDIASVCVCVCVFVCVCGVWLLWGVCGVCVCLCLCVVCVCVCVWCVVVVGCVVCVCVCVCVWCVCVCVQRAKQVGDLRHNWENNFWHLVLLIIKKIVSPHAFENSRLGQLNGVLQPFFFVCGCVVLPLTVSKKLKSRAFESPDGKIFVFQQHR